MSVSHFESRAALRLRLKIENRLGELFFVWGKELNKKQYWLERTIVIQGNKKLLFQKHFNANEYRRHSTLT